MKAMILAAGQGTRLKPLTDAGPKALIEVAGTPVLEFVIRRLKAAGVDEVVINLHHKGEMIEEFLKKNGYFGVRFEFSREEELLGTGGGLKKAAAFLGRQDFFLHNADVLSTVDLAGLYCVHRTAGALATLSVRERDSSRHLLFDKEGNLRGRKAADQPPVWAGLPAAEADELAFDGIHVVSPALFDRMTETGAFPITGTYLRLAAEGASIRAFRSDASLWAEIGTQAKLDAAARLVAQRGLENFL
ncbi:MAG: nucleotidyltransferase family protein [Elusimicrobia bacterium]|nr:nucleotidyltransferase family protein [Elusimicrobiota bacterium]